MYLIVVLGGAAIQVAEVGGSRAFVHDNYIHAAVTNVSKGSRSFQTEATSTADDERVDGNEASTYRLPRVSYNIKCNLNQSETS